jgi:hypothetical protein
VEGDLFELDLATLAEMRGAVDKINRPVSEVIAPLQYGNASQLAIAGLSARHREKQVAQRDLREMMAYWGGLVRSQGLEGSARQIRFFREFGVDVMSAQALGRKDAEGLHKLIENSLNLGE